MISLTPETKEEKMKAEPTFRDSIKHVVTVEFEPQPFEGGYHKGPKSAHMMEVSWEWGDGAWVLRYPKIFYARVKKNGELYSETLDAILWSGEVGQFAELIEASRPQYTPVLVGGTR